MPKHNNAAHQGFYAYRPSEKELPLPVAIWYNGGRMFCKVGEENRDNGISIWPYIMQNPITHATYKAVLGGAPWPEEIRIKLPDGREDSTMLGHNAPDDEALRGNMEEWATRIKKAIKSGIKSKEDADALSDLCTKARDLYNDADKKRLAETAPIRDQVDQINDTWQRVMKPTKSAYTDGFAVIDIYIREEQRKQREALKAQEEAAREKGEAAPVLQAAPIHVGTRKTVKSVKTTIVTIEDWKKVMEFIANLETIPADVKDAVQSAALRLLRAGVAVPGAKLDTKEKAS